MGKEQLAPRITTKLPMKPKELEGNGAQGKGKRIY
jgi:hypothetical protein